MKWLITGGFGFIGSNFVHYINQVPSNEITVVDKLTYAADTTNLNGAKYQWSHMDINAYQMKSLVEWADIIVNFAAESHVDNSINSDAIFWNSNLLGVRNICQLLKNSPHKDNKLLVQLSTDEVYGSAPKGYMFAEDAPLNPGNPYSASKAAADMLINSYINTYKIPAITVRPTNNYGPRQYPEKLIPFFIARAVKNESLPVYGNGMQERVWLHVEDTCRAIMHLVQHGKVGEVYNISSYQSHPNIYIVERILEILGKPKTLIKHIEDRPGHDKRYAIDSDKLWSLDWEPKKMIYEKDFDDVVNWYLKK